MASLPRTGAFFRRTLDCPFTDKGIQAYELKRVHRASGQSAVRRHTRASIVAIVVVVVAVAVVLIATIALQRPLMVVMQPRLVMR